MSFSPPSPPHPGSGPGQPPSNGFAAPPPPPPAPTPGGPRSTPIPGVPGLDDPPPTTAQFLGSLTDSPTVFGTQQAGTHTPSPPPSRERRGGPIALLFLIGPVLGIGVGVWALLENRERNDQAERILDDADATVDSILADVRDEIDDALDDVPPISIPDLTMPSVVAPEVTVPGPSVPAVPPVTLPVDTAAPAATDAPAPANLFDATGAPALVGTFESAIGASPARLLQLVIYPTYAFASAQSPTNPAHVDEYPYRDGVVGASSPVTLVGDGDVEANLYDATEVDWTFIGRAVAEAPGLMPDVEEGAVTHVIVDRSVFRPDFAVTVRVYVAGPRGGGYVEYTATGDLIQVVN